MSTIRRNATVTAQDQWSAKRPAQAAHLNVAKFVDSADTATWVQGIAQQENIYAGFDFSDIPEGSTINSITVRQRSLNLATQNSRSTRFALGVAGVEKVSATYDVTSTADVTQVVVFEAPAVTCADLRAGLLDIRKRAFGAAPGTNPPVRTE